MRHIKILLLVSFGATIALAQSLPHFDHIIIVFQENRTPDNLFGSAPTIVHCGTQNPFEAGVDIQDGGLYQGATTCLTARHMNDTF
jgi:phospholipase C